MEIGFWILFVVVWVLFILCIVLCGRIVTLECELNFYKQKIADLSVRLSKIDEMSNPSK
jgi:hypothetical protein